MKLVVAISGASGVHLGMRFVELLPAHITPYLVLTESARSVLKHEGMSCFEDSDIAAPIASGSFGAEAMAVIPCSMNTLAKIACGIADNLTTRAASVMIKERRPLLLAPRETPFSPIALQNMLTLSQIGVTVAPPVLGYYGGQETLEEMERFLIGKWLDLLRIPNDLYPRWGESDA